MIVLAPKLELSVGETGSKWGHLARNAQYLYDEFVRQHRHREVVGVEFAYVPITEHMGGTSDVRIVMHVSHREKTSP